MLGGGGARFNSAEHFPHDSHAGQLKWLTQCRASLTAADVPLAKRGESPAEREAQRTALQRGPASAQSARQVTRDFGGGPEEAYWRKGGRKREN